MSANLIMSGWGYAGLFRQSWALPLSDKVASVNGFNANLFYFLKNGMPYELGLDPPAAAPTILVVTMVADQLDGAINDTVTAIKVDSFQATWPTSGVFVLLIEAERVLVTGGHGTVNLTVVRGWDGTVKATHADNTAVAPVGITGTFRYRVRRWDKVTKTLSLASPETAEIVATAQQVKVTMPAEPTQRSGCQWIVERTTNKGPVFFPLNTFDVQNNSFPDGQSGTTYFDTTPDDTPYGFRTLLGEFQGKPRAFRLANLSDVRLFLAGGIEWPVTLTFTNNDATVTSSEPVFTQRMADEGWQITAGDTDGQAYVILTFTNSRSVELSRVYEGATGSKSGLLASPSSNRYAWSESFQPEYYGAAVVTGVGNEEQLGDAHPIRAFQVLGKFGSTSQVLFAKSDQLHVLSYSDSPAFERGGRVAQINARRGALSGRSMVVIDGRAFAMDTRGMWAMDAGGAPQEIGDPLRADWNAQRLEFAQREEFWIEHEPERHLLLFWVVAAGETRTKFAYEFDLDDRKWVGTRRNRKGHTAGAEFPDSLGVRRAFSFCEVG